MWLLPRLKVYYAARQYKVLSALNLAPTSLNFPSLTSASVYPYPIIPCPTFLATIYDTKTCLAHVSMSQSFRTILRYAQLGAELPWSSAQVGLPLAIIPELHWSGSSLK